MHRKPRLSGMLYKRKKTLKFNSDVKSSEAPSPRLKKYVKCPTGAVQEEEVQHHEQLIDSVDFSFGLNESCSYALRKQNEN